MTVSRGRINHAMQNLRALHEMAYQHEPSRADMNWYQVWSESLLEADDMWMARQPKVSDANLRVQFAKVQERLREERARAKQRTAAIRERAAALNARGKKAGELEERVRAAEATAEGWRLSAEANTKAYNIVRAQLEAAGIEIDRRVR